MLGIFVQAAERSPELPGFMQKIVDFLDTPFPYSPFTEYFAVLLLLWLLARRSTGSRDFAAEAQRVLDQKFEKGEIDRKTYEKFRQELSLQLKHE